MSSDCDGDVLIWDLNHSDGVPKAVKTLSGAIAKADSESNILGTVAWKPDGKQFAFSGRLFGKYEEYIYFYHHTLILVL